MNGRRKIIVALGAGALAAPLSLFAQQQNKVWRVGFLAARHVDFVDSDYYYGPFRQGMRELGYVEGKNLKIEWRSAEGNNERLPQLAAELVALKVDLILAAGTPATRAAQKATASIPITMGNAADPVSSGLVTSLARPGNNITGLSGMIAEVSVKQLEMLLNMSPKLLRVAVLINPDNASHAMRLKTIQAAAPSSGVAIIPVEAHTAQEIGMAFSTMVRNKAAGVIVARDSLFNRNLPELAALAAKYRMPSISGIRQFVEAGGLMSYGPNLGDQFRRAATYVDKIFRGAKPANLPIEQPTKFELFINGKTAKALSLKIPQSLLITADKVV
jgi:putative tryptophan/tyrosine transport system substrate-binding protein